MKKITFFLMLLLSQFLFAQKIYTKNQVDKQPTFSACNNRIDEKCFEKKLGNELNNQLMDYSSGLSKGLYKTTISFTINENGKFSDYVSSGNKKLGEKSILALKKIMQKQDTNKVKVIPASIKEKAVKMKYNLPVRIAIEG